MKREEESEEWDDEGLRDKSMQMRVSAAPHRSAHSIASVINNNADSC